MPKCSFFSRRLFLATAPAALAATRLPPAMAETHDATQDPRLTPRIIGNPNAKILVQEWFSLTCTHCAHFATEEFPKIREQFIDTGKIRYQFHDFPLDQISLIAAMMARSLPEERYLPFISALLSSQMQWAFNSDNKPLEHLRSQAALAGISSAQFDRIMNDKAFMKAIATQTEQDTATYHIEGTPYFRFNNTAFKADPETVEKFAELVAKAG